MHAEKKLKLITRLISLAAIGDLFFGAFVLARFGKLWFWLHRNDWPKDWNPPNYSISYWTIFRPWIFLAMWILALVGIRRRNTSGLLVTLFAGLVMAGCYVFSWEDFMASIQAFMQSIDKTPFIFSFSGFNEWDVVRLLILLVLAYTWINKSKEPDLGFTRTRIS